MRNLGIELIYQGQHNKLEGYADLLERVALDSRQVAFVGDDVVDLPVMRKVGLAIAVQDAHPWVIKHAHWQTPRAGGRGAARDVCELLLEAHGVLQQELDSYL
jgi:3-deoxy-D-manno-octulosonate 8-phosphate phosphatase (KDO 8-P phosphatase)